MVPADSCHLSCVMYAQVCTCARERVLKASGLDHFWMRLDASDQACRKHACRRIPVAIWRHGTTLHRTSMEALGCAQAQVCPRCEYARKPSDPGQLPEILHPSHFAPQISQQNHGCQSLHIQITPFHLRHHLIILVFSSAVQAFQACL